MRLFLMCGVLIGFCSALAGCGKSGVAVEGNVVKGGKPYTLGEGEGITITMRSEDGKTTCSGSVEKDGNFKMSTTSGALVPPGKYSVSYVHYPPKAAAEKAKSPPSPSSKTSSESWDVTTENKSFTLDLDKSKPDPKSKSK